MFKTAIDELFLQQHIRLSLAHGTRADDAFKTLKALGLDPDGIDRKACSELKHILMKEYEEPIASTRLNGRGWTISHIKDHMRRFLQSKIRHAGEIMKTHIEGMLSTLDALEEADGPEADGPEADGPEADGPEDHKK